MSKLKTVYICSKCGSDFPAWQGKCGMCGEWNSLVAEVTAGKKETKSAVAAGEIESLSDIQGTDFSRISTGISEFNRVLGGGIVSGSLVLLGGEPGIGKSTLVLQTADNLSRGKIRVLYVSGEESASQIKLRAERLNLSLQNLDFLSERNIDVVVATIEKLKPKLVIIDSIQTVFSDEFPSEAGSVTQVRLCTQKLQETAKSMDISIFLIGHVTKEGNVAGPKTLEHLVDTVLYLEGERYHTFRLLRGIKNRFGATDETGVLEMTQKGLLEVKNPSELFLEERKLNLPGSCVTATIEGMRAFLVEVQALCSTTVFGYPKRTASGLSLNRLQLIVAVLKKRARLRLANQDIYVSVAGGFRVAEPAIDLVLALAIFSAFSDKPLDPSLVALGEIGLSGELRRVSQIEKRVREAKNLGFKKIILPEGSKIKETGLEIIRASTIKEAIAKV